MSVRLGLAGCGRLAEVGYVPAARLVPEVELVAFADPDPERRELLAGESGRAYESVEALLYEEAVDGLIVASPPAAHEQAAQAAALAGVGCLVEKPPAPDAAGAERLAALEPAPYVGFNRRFSLGAGLVGALPAAGRIELELRYRRFSWAPLAVHDPALLDLAPHLVDLALRIGLGEPESVAARSPRPERVTIELRSRRGEAHLECACDRFHRERLVIRGVDGTVVARRAEGGLWRGALQRLRPGPHPLVSSLAAQLRAFASGLRGEGRGELATASEGAQVMRVIAAAAASLALAGEPVPFPDGVEGVGIP
jgi:predicted dehydrogenase